MILAKNWPKNGKNNRGSTTLMFSCSWSLYLRWQTQTLVSVFETQIGRETPITRTFFPSLRGRGAGGGGGNKGGGYPVTSSRSIIISISRIPKQNNTFSRFTQLQTKTQKWYETSFKARQYSLSISTVSLVRAQNNGFTFTCLSDALPA